MLRLGSILLSLCIVGAFVCSRIFAQDSEPPISAVPVLEQIVPAPGETVAGLVSIEVRFDRVVLGVDAADLLVNGQAAIEVDEVVQGQFVFTLSTPIDGPIEVRWRSDHAIADENGAPFAGGAWSYTLNSRLPPQVIISEFMASNKRTLRDADGDSSDWIELFNPSDEEASLEGWFLTDSSVRLQQWEFPAVSIPAKGYLVIFASGKDRREPGQELHTNFKLSDNGQFLGLISPGGATISAFAPSYPAQSGDISYGRAQGSSESVGYFSKPTPGGANSIGGAGFAGEVQFSAVSGLYTNSFLLTLGASSNAVIRYTLNGTLPTNSSPIYLGPIAITNTTVLRARAFQDRLLPGPVRTENFAFFSNLESFTSTLPILVVQTLGRAPVATVHTTSEFSLFPARNGVTTLNHDPALTIRGGIHLRGSSTRGLAKSSYAVELWDEFNNSEDVSLLGLPADSDWVLYAPNSFEPIMIHNPFTYQLSREIGQYSPRTRFVELFIQTKGGSIVSNNYNGIYVLEEKIKIGKDRVNIDKLKPQNITSPTVTGGYLLKVDRTGPGESAFPAAGANVVYVDPKQSEVREPARRPQDIYVRTYFSNFGKALSSPNYRDPVTGYRAFIDEDSWIDYHLLEVLSGNVDSLVLSCYFHKPREGKLTFGPHWDFDRALGSTDGRDANPRTWSTGPFFTAAWWSRMFTDKDFWQHWADRWQELRKTTLSADHLAGLIDALSGELREAQPRETKKWHVSFRGGNGYQGEIEFMKNWVSNRTEFIDRQFTQPAVASVPPGPVSSGTLLELKVQPAATIYYTLDGTDPRASQGELAPSALAYRGPIVITGNARLFARARNLNQRQTGGPPASTPWSGPTVGTYYVSAPPQLLVTEINFHPMAPAGLTNSASDYEFIEIKNPGAVAVTLPGMVVSGGVSFKFAAGSAITQLKPGERLLLVKNEAAFRKAFPAALNIAGAYTGSLGNDGDRLTLKGALGEPIFDFKFSDSWQAPADGLGFTLTLASEGITPAALGDERSWRASSSMGGSPGSEDPVRVPDPVVQVTEVLTNPKSGADDKVELYNPSRSEVNVSGWFLTDDRHAPFKYRIPEGTYIGARRFLVLSDTQFNDGATAFGLSAAGDAIYLFAADANGNLTGSYHGFSFGGGDPGRSFGLFTTPEGRQVFIPQSESSFGFPNGYPEVGPVVMSEIMYGMNAENSQGEFIELQNLSEATVDLSSPGASSEGWRLRGGIAYDFPPGASIAPHETIVLTAINPANQYFANQFRSRYGIRPGVRLFGPWSGTLANEGDSLELQRPLRADSTNTAPNANSTVVDQVHYSPQSPWPDVTDANGRSLLSIARVGLSFFGDDPANWTANLPTPGESDSDGDGLPDWWEVQYGLNPHSALGEDGAFGDPDEDGFANHDEFLAGTSPRDANSFLFLNQAFNGRDVLLDFVPMIGRSYSVYYTDDLNADSWHRLRNFSVVTNTTPIVVRDQALKTTRYYKLQVP